MRVLSRVCVQIAFYEINGLGRKCLSHKIASGSWNIWLFVSSDQQWPICWINNMSVLSEGRCYHNHFCEEQVLFTSKAWQSDES